MLFLGCVIERCTRELYSSPGTLNPETLLLAIE